MRPDASAKIQAAAPRKGHRRSVIAAIVAAVVVVGVGLAVLIGVNSSSPDKTVTSGSASAQPVGATGLGGGIVANTSAVKANAPTLDLYEDFQCPICGQLEKFFGAQIGSMAKAGDIRLVVHMMSFLDAKLGNDSSVRAASAAACAADAGKFYAYHDVVYANQPSTEGQGYTDAQLKDFAAKAGLTGAALSKFDSCYAAGTHTAYVKAVETASEQAGVFGTPTLKLNGKTLELSKLTPQYLTDQVKAATK